jgi:hypothetical protein
MCHCAHHNGFIRILITRTSIPYNSRSVSGYPTLILVDDPKMSADYTCHSFLYFYKIIELIAVQCSSNGDNNLKQAPISKSLQRRKNIVASVNKACNISWDKAIRSSYLRLNSHMKVICTEDIDKIISDRLNLSTKLNNRIIEIAQEHEGDGMTYLSTAKLVKTNEDIKKSTFAFVENLLERRLEEPTQYKFKLTNSIHTIALLGIEHAAKCPYEKYSQID